MIVEIRLITGFFVASVWAVSFLEKQTSKWYSVYYHIFIKPH